MIKRNITKLLVTSILSILSLTGCSVMLKDTDMADKESVKKISKDIIFSFKTKDVSVRKIAIGGFISSAVVSEKTGDDALSIISSINDLVSSRSCKALEMNFETAINDLTNYGFIVVPQDIVSKNEIYQSMGDKGFPGLCNAGSTRLRLGNFSTETMNDLIKSLNVDGILLVFLDAEYDSNGKNSSLMLFTKGEKYADLSWQASFMRGMTVDNASNSIFFRDLEELNKSDKEKIALTRRVFDYSFKLLLSKMSQDLLNK